LKKQEFQFATAKGKMKPDEKCSPIKGETGQLRRNRKTLDTLDERKRPKLTFSNATDAAPSEKQLGLARAKAGYVAHTLHTFHFQCAETLSKMQ
jgi:hypothetical protein